MPRRLARALCALVLILGAFAPLLALMDARPAPPRLVHPVYFARPGAPMPAPGPEPKLEDR